VDIDYGLAVDFIDDKDGRPLQLRFRRNWAPTDSPETFDGTGQLIAVVVDADRADNGDIVAISRPDVSRADVETTLDGWQTWAELTAEPSTSPRSAAASTPQASANRQHGRRRRPLDP
jgi:hypothetical protein